LRRQQSLPLAFAAGSGHGRGKWQMAVARQSTFIRHGISQRPQNSQYEHKTTANNDLQYEQYLHQMLARK
jgi:hypothetical protein